MINLSTTGIHAGSSLTTLAPRSLSLLILENSKRGQKRMETERSVGMQTTKSTTAVQWPPWE